MAKEITTIKIQKKTEQRLEKLKEKQGRKNDKRPKSRKSVS